jgi:ABC transport system ATP-binding/permease protein
VEAGIWSWTPREAPDRNICVILLSAHKIEKAFASKTLFTGVSLGIEDKERVGLVGPNGAGKSTLLKILAGVSDADEGTVSRKKGLRLGFLDQNPQFKPNATILETILEKCPDHDESMMKVYELVSHLELAEFGLDCKVSQLSGGWKKRVALARELAMEPELLFMDEPTNHLDISGILWLEDYLANAPFSVVLITHDRLFLQRTTNRIIDLDPRNPNYLLSVKGDYSMYMEAKELELAALQRHERVEKNRLRRETEWLRRGAQGRQTKQQARIQSAGNLKDTVDDLKSKNQTRVVDLEFGAAEHSPKKLIEAEGVSKSFGERHLFENVDFLITPRTRLGLLGDNGCGKSTLIKVLLGLEPPDTGKIKMAEKIEIAYFEQSSETLEPKLSVLKNICPDGDYVFFQGTALHVRSYLDRFFFQGQKAELPVERLSGGEQARLRLAKLMLRQCQVLVLDEPTNDLDSDTLDSLEDSLKEFNGAVILVTHDRYFLDAVANQILAFPPPTFASHKLEKFSSYFQWEAWFLAEKNKKPEPVKAVESRAEDKKPVKLTFKEKFELENMEATILEIETELARLTKQSEDEDAMSDHKKLAELHSKIALKQGELDRKFERWTELAAKK